MNRANPLISRLLMATKLRVMRFPTDESPLCIVASYDVPPFGTYCGIVSTLTVDTR